MENRLQRKPRTHFGCDLSMAARRWLGDHDDCMGSIGFKGFCMAVATLWPWYRPRLLGVERQLRRLPSDVETWLPGVSPIVGSLGGAVRSPLGRRAGQRLGRRLIELEVPDRLRVGRRGNARGGAMARSARSTLRPGNAFFAAGLPCAITLIGILRVGLSDRHLSIREQRPVMMIFGLVSGRLTCWSGVAGCTP